MIVSEHTIPVLVIQYLNMTHNCARLGEGTIRNSAHRDGVLRVLHEI